MTTGKLVYVRTVAKALCCTEKHVYELLKDGKLEGIRMGKRGIRIFEASVKTFIEKRIIVSEDYYK